jgi:glycosyltransferase involved in cell wall biosynthesis
MIAASIVIPCFNEAENLPHLIAGFESLRTPDADWELILVDNASTDATVEVVARELSPERRRWARCVRVEPPNLGYGHGLVTGLRAAAGEWLAWTHADGQTPPSDVLKGLDLLRSAHDPRHTLVKGRRRHRPLKDAAFTAGMQLAGLALLGRNLPDVNGQPKCFHRDIFARFDEPPTDLSLDLYLVHLAQTAGFTRLEFDVRFGDRLHGESKWAFSWRSKARNIARTLHFMRSLRRR